jgi:hypothetical protein
MLTRVHIKNRWSTNTTEKALFVYPPSSGGCADVAVPFEGSNVFQGLWYTIYHHIRIDSVPGQKTLYCCRLHGGAEKKGNDEMKRISITTWPVTPPLQDGYGCCFPETKRNLGSKCPSDCDEAHSQRVF